MGYDIDRFVNLSPEIAENFKCSICLDIFEAPLELPCGHIFCLECIRSCFDSSTTCECPECRQRVESREVKPPNRKLLCLLDSFNIKCEFADRGCYMVVKLENLIAHTRECQCNTSPRPRAPTEEPNYGNPDTLTDLLGENANLIDRLERIHRLQAILAFSQMINQIEEGENDLFDDERSRGSWSDNELLIQDDTSCELLLWGLISLALLVFLSATPIAAIVISSLKLHSCTQMPTLPRALLATGISMFLSVILETTRKCCYKDKFCVGLKFIQCFAIGSLIYLAVVVYSNLDYTIKTPHDNSTLTCDGLLFEFSFWFVSALLALICIIIILFLLYIIYKNVTTTWSEWGSSYVLLSFIYTVAFSGIIISVSVVTMGSVYFDSCPAIPSLTTKLIVFGTIGIVCWLIMLLNIRDVNCYWVICFWLVISLIASFICVAVAVHENFPWEFNSHASHRNINCNTTIYTYSFVIVCINYVIIGSTIFMYLIYGGICACLFFK